MKDFEYYSTLTTPRLDKEFATYYYRNGECIGRFTPEEWQNLDEETRSSFHGAVKEGTITNAEAFEEARKARRNEELELIDEFKRDLLEEFGLTGHPKANLLFSMAWERGHSDGYAHVFDQAEELYELLKP